MQEYTQTERMTYESRIALVQQNFIKQMALLYTPHNHLKESEGAAVYMQEVAEAINSRISSHVPNSDSYKDILRSIWRICTSKQKSRFWFDLSTIIAATNQANKAWELKHAPKKKTQTFGNEVTESDTRKKGEGWTLEGAQKALAETDRMIASGELGRGIGEICRKIPLKAISRLGGNADIPPPPVQETPPEHLPPKDKGIDIELIKKGMTAPKFDPFDLEQFDDPLPENMQSNLPSLDSL
jgi:hypothetical protein